MVVWRDLRISPIIRRMAEERIKDYFAASTNEMIRLKTEVLATDENLTDLKGPRIDRVADRNLMKQLILNMNILKTSRTVSRKDRSITVTLARRNIIRRVKAWCESSLVLLPKLQGRRHWQRKCLL